MACLEHSASPVPVSCVLLADRHSSLVEGVRDLLRSVFDTVVMVADEASLFEGATRLQPEVIVVDLGLAQSSNLDWVRRLREACPVSRLVLLTVHDEPSVRRVALEAGAHAVVLKRAIASDLLPVVEAVRVRSYSPPPTSPDTLSQP